MVAEQRCPECGAPIATGAPYCPNGHAIAWREEPEDRTTDLAGADRGGYGDQADRGRYGDEALVTQRVANDEPLPRREPAPPTERTASASPPGGGPGGPGAGGGLQRVRRGPNPAALVLGVLLLGVLAAAGWYFLNARGDGAVPAGAATTPAETATAGAVASASPVPTATEPEQETYEIQAGDSLSGIAAQFETTVDALAAENEITDINRIVVGQVLVIPPETGTASP